MPTADVASKLQARSIRLNRIVFCGAWLFVAMLVAMRAFGQEVSWPLWAGALLNAGNTSITMFRLPPRVSIALSLLSIGVAIGLMIAGIVSVAR